MTPAPQRVDLNKWKALDFSRVGDASGFWFDFPTNLIGAPTIWYENTKHLTPQRKTRKTHCFGHYCIWPSLVDGFELDPCHLSVLGGSHGMAVPGISDLSVPGMVSIFSKFLIQLIHHFYFVPGVVCRLFLYLHGGGQRCKHHHDQQGLAKVPTFGTGEKSNTKRSKIGESSSALWFTCVCIFWRGRRRKGGQWPCGQGGGRSPWKPCSCSFPGPGVTEQVEN